MNDLIENTAYSHMRLMGAWLANLMKGEPVCTRDVLEQDIRKNLAVFAASVIEAHEQAKKDTINQSID